jgi:hypothetical protein
MRHLLKGLQCVRGVVVIAPSAIPERLPEQLVVLARRVAAAPDD